MHQAEFSGDLLVVTSRKHFIQFLHGLVVSVDVLGLGVHFVIQFECSSNYVFCLDHKIVKEGLLVRKGCASRAFRFVEALLDLLKSLQVHNLAELLIVDWIVPVVEGSLLGIFKIINCITYC